MPVFCCGSSLYSLAHGGGGRGDVLHHVKSKEDCPGGGFVQEEYTS